MWEDPRNVNGGRWVITLDRKKRLTHLDNVWLEIQMLLIGNVLFQHGNIVNGAVVSIRNKVDRVAIWIGNSQDEEAIKAVGKAIKAQLSMSDSYNIAFVSHEMTKNQSGSTIKAAFTV